MSGLNNLQNVRLKDDVVSFTVAPGVLQQLLSLPSLPSNNNLMLIAQKVEAPPIQASISNALDNSQSLRDKPYFKSVKGYFADRTGVAQICRTCYKAVFDNDFVKLFDDKNKTASEKLRMLLKLVVRSIDLKIYEDPIMCAKCVEKLHDCHEFLLKCWDTEVKFSHWVSQRKRVQQNEVNLLILLEKSDNKGVVETAPKVEETIDLKEVVLADHSYTIVSQRDLKVKKKFSYKLKLSKETVGKRVKIKRNGWKKGPFLCEKCGYTVKTYKCFLKHLTFHAKGNVTVCNKSKKCEMDEKGKKRPAVIHKCNHCEKSYKLAKSLELHIKSIHLGAPETSQCHICGKSLKYASNLRLHLLSHNPDRNFMYICEICGKQFLGRYQYRKHILIHDPQTYPCDVCGKVLKRKATLEKHRQISHEKTGKVKCDLCQRQFWKVCDLKNHKIKYHVPGRERKCETCQSFFTSEKKLKLHMETYKHSLDCGFCSAKFKNSKSLQQHLDIVHGDGGKFKCEICNRGFSGEKSLLKHAFRVHGVNMEDEALLQKEEELRLGEFEFDKENLDVHDREIEENYFEIEDLQADGEFDLDKKNVLVEAIEGFSVF